MDELDSIFGRIEREARRLASTSDSSHDFAHADRVARAARIIADSEGADVMVVVPAAYFHDIVVYPKNDPRSRNSSVESAEVAKRVLEAFPEYSSERIAAVEQCIRECSFSKDILPSSVEGKVLQDADLLEATGLIAILRTFASCGQMGLPFYNLADPFCQDRVADGQKAGLDLFFQRLLLVPSRLHTSRAKEIAERRHKFLLQALEEFRLELLELGLL